MTSPLVSVCVPVYNGMPFVGRTIDSVLAQSLEDLELVIVDNRSTDGTYEMLRGIRDPRVRVLRNNENVGAIANWNIAVAEACGTFIKMLPADDILYPACLARQSTLLLAEPDVVLVSARRDVIDVDDRVVRRAVGLRGLDGKLPGDVAIRSAIRSGSNIFGEPGSTLFRRSATDPSRPIFDARLPYVVDLRLWCDLLSRGALFAIRDPLNAFRIRADSESASLQRVQRRDTQALLREVAAASGVSATDLRRGIVNSTARSWLRRVFVGTSHVRRRLRTPRLPAVA